MLQLIRLFKAILNILYRLICPKRTQKKVLFMSRENDEPSVDFSLLEERIKRDHPDYDITMLCKRMVPGRKGAIPYMFHIFKQVKEMAPAKIVILDTYNIPASMLRHRRGQTIVQIWHSIGTMKKNSYSILDQPEGRSSKVAYAMDMHKNYDLIFCAGEGYRDYLAESFNYPPEALTVVPLPRVDLLRDKDWMSRKRGEILSAYPWLKGGKVIVYAPTFRMGEDEQRDFADAVNKLREAVAAYGDKYRLVVKSHPIDGMESDCDGFSTMEMLSVADVFISDYSCSIYEAGVAGVPLYFYTYDFDEYMSKRSVYMDYKAEIPGAMHADAHSLMKDIDAGGADASRQKAFIDKYVELPEGSAAEKMVKIIFDHAESR